MMKMASRIKYPKPSYYSKQVLVGSWFEDRAAATALQPEIPKYSTDYDGNFGVKPPSKIDPAIKWDLKLNSEESNFISQVGRYEFPNYFENFSTTYDLAFNHFPKWACQNRRGQDFASTYANLTNHGLLEYKRNEWECDKPDPRRNLSTAYNDTYMAPNKKDYQWNRAAIPLANSSLMNKTCLASTTLKLRGNSACVPSHSELVTLSRPDYFNPITWENVSVAKFSKNCT